MPLINIDSKLKKEIPLAILEKLSGMSELTQEAFVQEFKKQRKTTFMARCLLIIAGAHYLYVGKIGMTILFWITFGGLMMWAFIDFWGMGKIIRERNQSIALDILKEIQVLA